MHDVRSPLTLDDLMAMDGPALAAVMRRGHPLDPARLAGRMYLGVDLSLPELARRLLWHTFRKTFHRDAPGGPVRGWNVRMQQRGVDGPRAPKRDRRGRPITFGHYVVRSATDVDWPHGWRGAHCLDYGNAGNTWLDPARMGLTPLVAVNIDDMSLLLGWEIFKTPLGMAPLPLYWALRDEGPLDAVVDPPKRTWRPDVG